jgi:hypothetical protein
LTVISPSYTNASSSASSSSKKAQALCTFTQTRFRVQIWTRRRRASVSDAGLEIGGSSADASGGAVGTAMKAAWQSSANEMRAPGSFPYRASFTLDRESGGDGDGDGDKGVICWALEEGKVVGEGVRIAEEEIRGLEARAAAAAEDGSGDCSCGWES